MQGPLAKALEAAKLWRFESFNVPATNGNPARVQRRLVESKIRYAVICYGIPYRIEPDPTHTEPGEDKLRPEFRRNEAAVDSELACLPLIHQNPPLDGPLRNPLYTTTNSASLNPTNGVLMVTRLDGPTPEIARGLVDKAMEAETNGLCGRAYFDMRGTTDPVWKIGDELIFHASEVSRVAGLETIVDRNEATFPASFPMSQIAIYIGWYTETVSGPFTLPQVEFMPGAFAYHLHSFSAAALRTPDHNWVGPLLAKGATISMGCVNEPYLGMTPDVGTFLARLVLQGFTFGEAAYAGQNSLSWQTTVVGDPLYRPFGKSPPQMHHELERRNSPLIEWSYLRVVNLNLVRGTHLSELVSYLDKIPATKHSAVLTEKLADLYAAQGKPSSAVLTYQQALDLNPSPQQRIRLRLTLGERLIDLNRDAEAFENYQKLLEEAPHYPGKPGILHKLLALAQKLGRKEDAARYEEQLK